MQNGQDIGRHLEQTFSLLGNFHSFKYRTPSSNTICRNYYFAIKKKTIKSQTTNSLLSGSNICISVDFDSLPSEMDFVVS